MSKTKHTIAISGASGFIGNYLLNKFHQKGWNIIPLSRKTLGLAPKELTLKLKTSDIIINLAGAPIIGRWTSLYKKSLYDSRVGLTEKLIRACSEMDQKPKVFISASAIGYYASGGPHTEKTHTRADNFLGELTNAWEKEAFKAQNFGARTIIFRLGVVLGKNGGALQQMLPIFKLGLGGTIKNGKQPFSWIHIQDLFQALITFIQNDALQGIYNLTAPNPTTNKGLTTALATALAKPAFLPVPEFVLRLKFGEGAQILTEGQTVYPKRLLESGFSFSFPTIDDAVNNCIKP